MVSRFAKLLVGFAVCVLAGALFPQAAHAGQVILRPSADPVSPNWQTYPTNGQARWSIMNRSDLSTSTWVCAATGNVADLYDLTDASVGQGATSMTVRAYTFMGSGLVLANAYIALNADINGVAVGTTSTQNPPSGIGLLNICTGAGGGFDWRSITYNGSWTQTNINDLKLNLGRQNNLLNGPIRVSQAEVVVTYTDPPTVGQSAYRIYQNANSTTPGSALAATNTVADVPNGNPFRVRVGATVSGTNWSAGYSSHKLQFASKNQSTCAASTGWADVTSGSGVVRWNDNASPSNGVTISSYAQDPSVTGSATYQQYREANSFTNPNAIAVGNTGLWDFALQTVGGSAGATYCLRIVNDGGDFTTTYSQYPEFTLTGDLTIDIVNASGVSVASPSTAFAGLSALPTCQTSTGTLGISAQRIRIVNNISTTGWTASIAATAGNTALWTSGGNTYDFNNPGSSGCTAGQLSISPSTGTSSPQSGCTNTGISLGSNSSFNQGVTDSISLISASSGAARFCYWELTGVGLSQKVPASQATGNYNLDLTITVLAQ